MSAEEYLRTSFEDGDREYVDGEVVERNIGRIDHGGIQAFLAHFFWQAAGRLRLRPATSVRIRVNGACYRVPDLAVWLGPNIGVDQHGVPVSAPFLAVEILSPEDDIGNLRVKVKEYLSIGVQWIWLIDPVKKTAECFSQIYPEGRPCETLRTETPTIEIALERVLMLQG
jgi:Uma2 family endonuclease